MGLFFTLDSKGGVAAGVSGAYSEAAVLDTSRPFSIIGVQFKAGGGLPFLGGPSDELHNCSVSLDQVWGATRASLRDRLRLRPAASSSPAFRPALAVRTNSVAVRVADGLRCAECVAVARFSRRTSHPEPSNCSLRPSLRISAMRDACPRSEPQRASLHPERPKPTGTSRIGLPPRRPRDPCLLRGVRIEPAREGS